MKFVKRFLLVATIFIIISVIISLFLPSNFKVERKIIVNADLKQIYNQVNDLKNWKNWSPWAVKDSSVYLIDNNYSNPSSGKGATFVWKSDNDELGEGKMEIVNSEKNELVEYVVDFGVGVIESAFALTELDDGVEVVWSMNMEFGFNPISKFMGLFMEDYVASDYELGLKRLKLFAEELPKINSVKVEKTQINQQWFLSIRDTIDPMEMNNIHGKMYSQINVFMDEKDIEMEDSPLVIYHFWSDSIIDIEAGIPIRDSIFIEDKAIKLNKINSGNVVTAIHYGPYERLIETYNGINEWMRRNEVFVTGPPWEKYITDPATEPNPDKWQTGIYFPVE